MTEFNEICQQMSDLDESALLQSLTTLINESPNSAQEALEACRAGLEQVGQRFEDGEYYLSDLIYAGELMSDAAALLKPVLSAGGSASLGKLLICTVKGDLHDIGKGIVVTMMEAAGFDVIDLGVDVAPEIIVKAAQENSIKIVALSAVLTLSIDSMRDTVTAFSNAGIRDQVKIIIGGNPASESICEYTSADAWTLSPQEGVSICRTWAMA